MYEVPTGIEAVTWSNGIKVYPNSFAAWFNILINPSVTDLAAYRYVVTDYPGRTVIENNDAANNNEIDMHHFTAAICC